MRKLALLLLTTLALAKGQGQATATIASGQSLSNIVELRPQGRAGFCALAVLEMPAAWTAADITFQASVDGVTFQDLYDHDGMEVTVKASAGRTFAVPAAYFWGLRWIRLRSGTGATPVAQAAERTIKLYCRE